MCKPRNMCMIIQWLIKIVTAILNDGNFVHHCYLIEFRRHGISIDIVLNFRATLRLWFCNLISILLSQIEKAFVIFSAFFSFLRKFCYFHVLLHISFGFNLSLIFQKDTKFCLTTWNTFILSAAQRNQIQSHHLH